MTGSRILRVLAIVFGMTLAGCATTHNGNGADPLEGFNRAMYGFNEGFDEMIATPVARAYKDAIPAPVRGGVRNFFSNIADVFIGLNNLLQGKLEHAVSDWMRVAVNSTIGLFGILDWASDFGFDKHDEDFGQTFGRWGAGPGAYVVWPFLGSSTVRDTIGGLLDSGLDPIRRHEPVADRNFMLLLRVTGKRADLLDASRLLEEAALDKYVFQRDAYLQRRESQILDGRRSHGEERPGRPVRESRVPAEPGAPVNARPVVSAPGVYEPRIPENYAAVLAATVSRH